MSYEDEGPRFMIELTDVDAIGLTDEQKHEWEQHVDSFLRSEYDFGYSRDTVIVAGHPLVEWKLNTPDDRERPRLRVQNLSDGFAFAVVADTKPTDEDVAVWRNAAQAGLNQLGTRTTVPWLGLDPGCWTPDTLGSAWSGWTGVPH